MVSGPPDKLGGILWAQGSPLAPGGIDTPDLTGLGIREQNRFGVPGFRGHHRLGPGGLGGYGIVGKVQQLVGDLEAVPLQKGSCRGIDSPPRPRVEHRVRRS